MLDPQSAHNDLVTSDPNEEQRDGHMAERDPGASESGETLNAGRPRLVCIGFAVIRI
jgi:hypothetical protein